MLQACKSQSHFELYLYTNSQAVVTSIAQLIMFGSSLRYKVVALHLSITCMLDCAAMLSSLSAFFPKTSPKIYQAAQQNRRTPAIQDSFRAPAS